MGGSTKVITKPIKAAANIVGDILGTAAEVATSVLEPVATAAGGLVGTVLGGGKPSEPKVTAPPVRKTAPTPPTPKPQAISAVLSDLLQAGPTTQKVKAAIAKRKEKTQTLFTSPLGVVKKTVSPKVRVSRLWGD